MENVEKIGKRYLLHFKLNIFKIFLIFSESNQTDQGFTMRSLCVQKDPCILALSPCHASAFTVAGAFHCLTHRQRAVMESEFGKLFLSNYRTLDSIQGYGSFFEKKHYPPGGCRKKHMYSARHGCFYIMRLPFFSGAGFCPATR